MAGLDLHVVIGNLGAAPELRYLPDGTAVTALKLAVNKKFTRRDGTVVDKTQWYEVTVTGKMAENCVQYLGKGRPVCVVGDGLEVPEWTDRETGQQRVGKTPRLYAMRVVFLGTNREGGVVEQEYEGSAPSKNGAADYDDGDDLEQWVDQPRRAAPAGRTAPAPAPAAQGRQAAPTGRGGATLSPASRMAAQRAASRPPVDEGGSELSEDEIPF